MIALFEIDEIKSQTVEKHTGSRYFVPQHTVGVKKNKDHLRLIFSGDESYDNIKMEGTTLSNPKEELSLERIYKEVTDARVDIAEIKSDIRTIKDSLVPVPEMSKDLAVLKKDVENIDKDFDGLLFWVRGIGVSVVAGIIIYVVTNILPLLTTLQNTQ